MGRKSKMPSWMEGLTHRDWMLNGEPIRTKYRLRQWELLDWSRAWVDAGPSPAGNPGPYWHVPWMFEGDELWARLYPRVMLTKWGPLLFQAASEFAAKAKAA